MGSNQDLINVTGLNGLNIGSATSVNLFDSSGTNSFSTVGTWPIMAYSGSLGGLLTNLTVGNPNLIAAYTFSTSATGFVDVNVSTGYAWSGSGGVAPFPWSTGLNWSSSAAISSGQSAFFKGTTGLSNSNDIPGLSLTGIVFNSDAGAFNLSGNSIQLSGAISSISTATQTIGLAIQMTAGSLAVNAVAGNIVLNGVLSDGGSGASLTVNGSNANTVVFGAANTYTGNTTVNSGSLSLANSLAVQYSTVSLGTSGGLTFASGITSPTLGGLAGAGKFALVTAASEAVTLNVGSDGQNTTYTGVMSGAGGLVKVGADTLTLNGATANSYSGATLINAGVLQATHSNVMSLNSAVAISNASTFNMTNTTQSIASLSSTDASGNQVLLGNGLLKIVGPGTTTFDGVISGGTGGVALQGSTLMLTNQNTYGGATTISGGGVLQLNSAGGPALTGNLTVAGGTAQWLQDNQVNSAANLAVSSGLADIGSHSNTVSNLQTTGGTITGTSGVLTSNNAVDARSGTINAILGGGAGLNKTTAGTVNLGAANTYSGSTSVGAGNLTLANPLALQNSTASMNGGVLAFAAGVTAPSVGALTGTGNIALATAATEPVALGVGGNGQTTTYSGFMSGTGGLVKQGGGTFAIASSQGYSGATAVSNGVLQLGPVTPLVPVVVNGFGGGGTGWQVNSNGIATTPITSDVLTLTDQSSSYQARSAFNTAQVPVGAFHVSYTYQATTGFIYPADGATFVLQNSSSGVLALGGTGADLGYSGTTGFTAVSPSAGMGMNLFNLNGNNNQLEWLKGGTFVSGSAATIAINTGDPIQVSLNYDGSNTLTTTWKDLTTSGTYSASFAIGSLITALGGTNAYFGFTGAEGSQALFTGDNAGNCVQTVSNFSYSYSVAGTPTAGTNILPTFDGGFSVTAGGSVDLYGGSDAVGLALRRGR